jgi:hypothetical protein
MRRRLSLQVVPLKSTAYSHQDIGMVDMRMQKLIRFGVLLAIAVTAAPVVNACGDKLVGIGGGVPFARIHPEHYVGNIVLFARPDSDLRSFNDKAHLSRHLERSGHTVLLIDNDRDLDSALRAAETRVVLATPADATALRARLRGSSAAPLVVALVAGRADADAAPSSSECAVQVSADQGRSALRRVENFISQRQAGTAPNCAGTAERS